MQMTGGQHSLTGEKMGSVEVKPESVEGINAQGSSHGHRRDDQACIEYPRLLAWCTFVRLAKVVAVAKRAERAMVSRFAAHGACASWWTTISDTCEQIGRSVGVQDLGTVPDLAFVHPVPTVAAHSLLWPVDTSLIVQEPIGLCLYVLID